MQLRGRLACGDDGRDAGVCAGTVGAAEGEPGREDRLLLVLWRAGEAVDAARDADERAAVGEARQGRARHASLERLGGGHQAPTL